MTELRITTLNEIEQILDRSYFTKAAFSVTNNPLNEPFLKIVFLPRSKFSFEVENYDEQFMTNETPGRHLADGEEFKRDDFQKVIDAIRAWVDRLKDDLRSRANPDHDLDLEVALESLRAKISTSEEDNGEEFSKDEVLALKSKLDELTTIVEKQSDASDFEIRQLKKEIENIKKDLEVMPKGIWKNIAGNKILKAVGSYIKTKEGRELLLNSVKKLLE